jgi:hypothetical protein
MATMTALRLDLDHLILRSPDPDETVAHLAAYGLPVATPPTALTGTLRSAILRAGSVDIEVLAIGADKPDEVSGYGIGLTAREASLRDVAGELRSRGLATSAPMLGEADGKRWEAIQVAGLLPRPFGVPLFTKSPGLRERFVARAGAVAARVPALARAATSDAGASMVVVTDYFTDMHAIRAAAAADGPRIVAVDLGAPGLTQAWATLGEIGGPELRIHDRSPAGIQSIHLAGAQWPASRRKRLGSVELVGASRSRC